jgi:hypothetical protein
LLADLQWHGTATAPSNVGIYNVTVTFSSTSPYFGNATGIGKLTIAPAPLTIAANNAVYLQGKALSDLTVTYTGFVNGETAAVLKGTLKVTTTATATSAVGNYPIVPSGLTAMMTFADGPLTVQGPYGISGKYIIKNVHSGLVLGVWGASTAAGANIVQWPSNGSPDQEWTLSLASNGAYLIHDRKSGMVIGVEAASTSQGTVLIQWPRNGSLDQQWSFTPSGSNWIITDVKSGLEMDIEGASTSKSPSTDRQANYGR